ncbi:MAG: SMP-30/gluconolactonase/LRE family protein [Bacteroidota bacterium]
MKAEVVLHLKDTRLGEGPVWDHRSQLLYWVNISLGRVHRYDPVSREHQSRSFDQYLGAVVPCDSGEFVLAMQHGFYFYDWDKNQLSFIVDPEKDKPLNRFNDAKCDPQGRFWAGSIRIHEPRVPVASLFCLDNNLTFSEKLSGIHISNGLAWTKEGNRMYYIDTLWHHVQSFDFEPSTAEIKNSKVVLRFKQDEFPDGMCIDENDNLWIAFYGLGKVRCYNPWTGKRLAEISVPASKITSCCFGGRDMDTLYITSGREKNDKEEYAGALFGLKVGVKGRETSFFSASSRA